MSDAAQPLPRGYEGVALVCPVTVPYVRQSDHGAAWFIGKALASLIDAAGISTSDIDGFAASSFTLAPDTSVGLCEHYGLSPRWLEWLPTGGASGVMALRRAARAVQAGDARVVACIAGDTAVPGSFRDLLFSFSSFSTDAVVPYGALGPNGVFAMIMRQYMQATGATRQDFARMCVMQRRNGALNPLALLRKPITPQDYMEARPIAEPVHLLDCVMPCAGADGFLVMSVDHAQALGLPWVEVMGATERHNAWPADQIIDRTGAAMDAPLLFAQAGVTPDDLDFVQTYDDYPVISFMQFEDLGLCPRGQAARFVDETDMTLDGSAGASAGKRHLPHNSSGGQLAMGQAGAAGGYLGLVEAMRQLTRTPLGPQIAGARIGLVSGYGMVNNDRGLCSAAAILRRGERP